MNAWQGHSTQPLFFDVYTIFMLWYLLVVYSISRRNQLFINTNCNLGPLHNQKASREHFIKVMFLQTWADSILFQGLRWQSYGLQKTYAHNFLAVEINRGKA